MLVKKGDSGKHVEEIQRMLSQHGCWTYHKFTQYFGDVTEKAVKAFQKKKKIKQDGEVGDTTMGYLTEGIDTDRGGKDTYDPFKHDVDNKLQNLGKYVGIGGIEIERLYLDSDEYVKDYGKVNPVNLILHHTAGWSQADATANNWNVDTRGRVGTQYVISGGDVKGRDLPDGNVVECFPDGFLAWHMGKVKNFNTVSKLSVGIEMCNFGYLVEKGGKYFTYTGTEVVPDQVCDLGFKFRGHQYWHKYSDKQIASLEKLMKHIAAIYPSINIMAGIPKMLKDGVDVKEAFEYIDDVNLGKKKGTWSHSTVRKDKFDVFPQPELVEMLKNFTL